eukprot:1159741-Pelagomonas_calceolata.AAC.11
MTIGVERTARDAAQVQITPTGCAEGPMQAVATQVSLVFAFYAQSKELRPPHLECCLSPNIGCANGSSGRKLSLRVWGVCTALDGLYGRLLGGEITHEQSTFWVTEKAILKCWVEAGENDDDVEEEKEEDTDDVDDDDDDGGGGGDAKQSNAQDHFFQSLPFQ